MIDDSMTTGPPTLSVVGMVDDIGPVMKHWSELRFDAILVCLRVRRGSTAMQGIATGLVSGSTAGQF